MTWKSFSGTFCFYIELGNPIPKRYFFILVNKFPSKDWVRCFFFRPVYTVFSSQYQICLFFVLKHTGRKKSSASDPYTQSLVRKKLGALYFCQIHKIKLPSLTKIYVFWKYLVVFTNTCFFRSFICTKMLFSVLEPQLWCQILFSYFLSRIPIACMFYEFQPHQCISFEFQQH